jgi:hypothetical protein
MTTEGAYWKALLSGITKSRIPILPYVPDQRQLPERVLPVNTAWKGIESILSELIGRFHVGTDRCLEFGVEHGYSTAALSSYFTKVTGVDTFQGDKHTQSTEDIYTQTSDRLADFSNIELIRSDYQHWIAKDDTAYDLIHVDIVHTYADTFACGQWSANHAKCVLFHDTESFPAVKQAVIDIARESGKAFYNYKESFGLGILV